MPREDHPDANAQQSQVFFNSEQFRSPFNQIVGIDPDHPDKLFNWIGPDWMNPIKSHHDPNHRGKKTNQQHRNRPR